MYTAEALRDLHSMNWLKSQVELLPTESDQRQSMMMQIETLRRRLPVSILSFHDRLAKAKRPSVVRVSGSSCGACHLRLPSGTLGELRAAGRFVLCPNCGVFVTAEAVTAAGGPGVA